MQKLKDLQARQAAVDARQKAILAEATTANAGELSEGQRAEFDSLESEYAANETAISKCQRDAADAARIASRQPTRVTLPTQTARTEGGTAVINGDGSGTVVAKAPEKFKTLGDQLQAIAMVELNGREDNRLKWQDSVPYAAISGAGSSVPSDGGYLIEKDLMTDLNNKVFSGGELLSRCDVIEIGPNSDGLKINTINETSRATGSRWGGVQVYWGAEADSATAKKPTFKQVSMELKDLIGLAYVTERLLADATALGMVYSKAFTEEFTFMMEDGIVNGTGAGQILGYMNSGAKVAVTRNTASRVKYADIVGIWSRMWARSRANSVWLINQDVEPDLFQMAFVVQNVAGTENVGGAPAYMPANGLSGSPFGTLMGRPVIPVEYCATLGTTNDIALVDLQEMAVIRKGGLAADSSIHVRFLNNERTFRWVARVDGMPKWTSAVTPFKGSATKSPFVVLT